MTAKVAPTARQVRAYFAENPGELEGISVKAVHTLTSRGRLAPEVRERYNDRHPRNPYTEGNKATVTVRTVRVQGDRMVRQPKALPADEVREAAVLAGFGTRGRLSPAQLDEVGAAFVTG